MNLTLPVITFAALADSLNPCAISVLLLTIGFLMSLHLPRHRITLVAGMYILGIFIAYILIGIGLLQALSVFGVPKFISKIGSVFIILSGTISLINLYFPSFPIKLQLPQFSKPEIARLMHKSTLPAMLLLGGFVGLFEFPCTGGPYLFILSLLHDQTTRLTGFLYLLYYNIIFILPLVLILALASHPGAHATFVSWRKTNFRRVELLSSLVMIILGLVIFLV